MLKRVFYIFHANKIFLITFPFTGSHSCAFNRWLFHIYLYFCVKNLSKNLVVIHLPNLKQYLKTTYAVNMNPIIENGTKTFKVLSSTNILTSTLSVKHTAKPMTNRIAISHIARSICILVILFFYSGTCCRCTFFKCGVKTKG